MDFVQQMGEMALGTRLKRISDYLFAEVNTIYNAHGVNLSSRAFIALSVIHQKGPLSVVDIAEEMGTSHPSISQIVPGLIGDGLLTRTVDPEDERRKLLSTTPEAEAMIEQAQPVWKAISAEVINYSELPTGNFIDAVSAFERRIAEGSFADKVLARLKRQEEQDGVNIVPFEDRFAPWLGLIHLRWMLDHYPEVLEPTDWETYADPRKKIIDQGGQIFFALDENETPIGTFALIQRKDNLLELAKMGIQKEHRGKGLGEALLMKAIDVARTLGEEELVLETGSRVQPAIRLYEKYGFVQCEPPGDGFAYERADIFMKLKL